jgi:tRNA-dihydrouridine synthase B
MKICDVITDSPFLLAPLAGITNSPMRRVCRRMGASMVWTEMVSAEGLIRESAKTFELLAFHPEERPIAFQLFGARPDSMAAAAARVRTLRPDVLDLNVGCPAKKVVRSGSGAALMKDPVLLAEIASATVESAAGLPVMAKIRSGWDEGSVNAVEVAQLLASSGMAAVAVHPRTRTQGFTGTSDWSIIRAVKEAISVPVIGSGDVRSPADALRMLKETSCDAVMIGRGALGNPWIFRRTRALAETGRVSPVPDLAERIAVLMEHLALMVADRGETCGVREMRKHLGGYLRGFPGASRLRSELVRIDGHEDMKGRLNEIASSLGAAGSEEVCHDRESD